VSALGTTLFLQKAPRQKLYANEINSIYGAINNLEAAINITPGSPQAAILDQSIVSLDAGKLLPGSSAAFKSLILAEELTVLGPTVLRSSVSFGPSGYINVKGVNGIDVLKLGYLGGGEYGLYITDGNSVNFSSDKTGQVKVRGLVEALDGSKFTGTLNLKGGNIVGTVSLGTGIQLKGATQEIVISASGRIVAGDNVLTATSFAFKKGSIEIGDFFLNDLGRLSAQNVDISGHVVITGGSVTVGAGNLGGIVIGDHGLCVGGFGEVTIGFSLGDDGKLYARDAEIRGLIHVTDGDVQGNLMINGSLVAPGVTLDQTGPHFSTLELNLANGRFVLANGKMTALDANVVGNIVAKSGDISGNISIGGASDLRLDGTLRKIVAGESELSSQGISFRQGAIRLGSGNCGPEEDKQYKFYIDSSSGILQAENVQIQGEFSGKIIVQAGSQIGGFGVDDTALFAGVLKENSSLILDGTAGSLTSLLGAAPVVKIDSAGLWIDNGALNIRTAISGSKEMIIGSSGIIMRRSTGYELRMDGEGITVVQGGQPLGKVISPDGFDSNFLLDNSITRKKVSSVRPNPVVGMTTEVFLYPGQSSEAFNVRCSWEIPATKSDGSVYDDSAGYRVYLKRDTGISYCLLFADASPDYPAVHDSNDPRYGVKTIILENVIRSDASYVIFVTTVDIFGNESTPVAATPVIPTIMIPCPNDIQAVRVSNNFGTVSIAWSHKIDQEFSYYELQRCESVDKYSYSEWLPLAISSSNFYGDVAVEESKWYLYRIRPVNRNGKQGDWVQSYTAMRPSNPITIQNDGVTHFLSDVVFRTGRVMVPDEDKALEIRSEMGHPSGLKARNLFVGDNYPGWPGVFGDSGLMKDEPGNTYISGDLKVEGRITSAGSFDGINLGDHDHSGQVGHGNKISYFNLTDKPVIRRINYLVPDEGLAKNAHVTLPGDIKYNINSNSLLVFINGILADPEDYEEVNPTEIISHVGIPGGTVMTFMVFQLDFLSTIRPEEVQSEIDSVKPQVQIEEIQFVKPDGVGDAIEPTVSIIEISLV
jgi:hypothetical protein